LSIHDHEQSCFEVENATEHELFHDNPLVSKYKFYAGAPLLNKMDLSWDLCVIDTKPNKLNERKMLYNFCKSSGSIT
jgi:hypothetical protein